MGSDVRLIHQLTFCIKRSPNWSSQEPEFAIHPQINPLPTSAGYCRNIGKSPGSSQESLSATHTLNWQKLTKLGGHDQRTQASFRVKALPLNTVIITSVPWQSTYLSARHYVAVVEVVLTITWVTINTSSLKMWNWENLHAKCHSTARAS